MSNRPTPDQAVSGENDRTVVDKPTESNLENDATIKDSSNTGEFAATIKVAASGGSVPARSKTELSAESRFGRYEVKKELGRGAMGAVYLALDVQLDREVAIKIPTFGPEDGPEEVERFYREARAMATLSHPNLCPVYDVGEIDGVHYLTMQFVEGRPMDDFLKGGKSHPAKQVAAVMRKLALALEEAHQAGVIHRDLKPANIMLDKRNEPIIMDFGLAQRRKENETTLTQAGQIMGTPSYMSPEQVKGEQDTIGPPSDVYALGVICYQLLTGKLPFTGSLGQVMAAILTEEPEPPSKLNKKVDRSIEAICLKAMAKDMGQRYASAAELAKSLRDYLRGKRLPEEGAKLALPQSVAIEPTASVNTTGKEVALADDFFADLVTEEAQAPATSPLGFSPLAQLTPVGRRTARPKVGDLKQVPKWVWIASGSGVGLLVLLGLIVLLLPGKHGTLRIEINDPGVEVTVSENGYKIKGAAKEDIELEPGEHLLTVKRGDFSFETDKFVLKSGETVVVKVEYIKDEIKVTRGETIVAKKSIPAGKTPVSPRAVPAPVLGRVPTPDRAVSFVESLGGKVVRDDKSPDKPVIGIHLPGTKVTDAGLKELAPLTNLGELNLDNTKVTDAGLKELSPFKNLIRLDLNSTKVTDAGLKELASLKNLNHLNLRGTKVTDAGIEELQKALPLLVDIPRPGSAPSDDSGSNPKSGSGRVDVGFPQGYFYMTTKSGEGQGLVLDSAPLELRKRGNSNGMLWKATPTGNGYFRLTTQLLEERQQVLEGGNPNAGSSLMVPNRGYTGTAWKATKDGDGCFTLTSMSMIGEKLDKVLYCEPDSAPRLATGGSDDSKWKFIPVSPSGVSSSRPPLAAIAPFSADEAKKHQQQCAESLGLPIEKEITLPGGAKLTLVLIPPGEFLMGSTAEGLARILEEAKAANAAWELVRIPFELPQHRVRISRPFYLGKYEVTQAQWQSVMGTNPSQFKDTPMHPVEQVNWDDTQSFLAKLNESNSDEKKTFAMPTEAQWEYACRAGTTTSYSFGESPEDLGQYGWFKGNSGGRTHPAGKLKPNPFGLYDMHGNAWEWCADPFVGQYGAAPVDDPTGASAGSFCVNRGGSWGDDVRGCRSAYRNLIEPPGHRHSGLGFRLALVLADQ